MCVFSLSVHVCTFNVHTWYIFVHLVRRECVTERRIHERTISLRFLGIILRVLRFEVSVSSVYITNQFQRGVGIVKAMSRGDCE
jgi:hypothetical protein